MFNKNLAIFCALSFLCLPVQAQTWVPEELLTFGSSTVNSVLANVPIPNEDNPKFPNRLAELLFVTGTNYGRPGIGTTENMLAILKDDYLVNGPPITRGTVHILGPFNGSGGGNLSGQKRVDAIADIVEMVQALTDAGAEHIYLASNSFGGRIAALYALAQTRPEPDPAFVSIVAAVDTKQTAWGDEVEAAVLLVNPDVRRLDLIDFMKGFAANPEQFDIAPEDFYYCVNNNSCIVDDLPPNGYGGENGNQNYVKLAFRDGIHLTYRGNNALAHYIAGKIWDDSYAVRCNDGGLSICGHSVKVRCEGPDANRYIGALMLDLDDAWVGKYLFWYEDDDDGADETDFVCGSEFGATTHKLGVKCTDVLKGNGKNSSDITVDIEMKYDPSKNDC